MKILITGFEPFGGEQINPSWETIKSLPNCIYSAELIKLKIPTVRRKSIEMIRIAIAKNEPDVILSLGQAGGRAGISVERIGINIDDFSIPDNEGNQPIDMPIIEGAPDAYFATVPIKAVVEKIRKAGIPAYISNTAGTFVCNHVCYGAAHFAQQHTSKCIKTGFIHIPFLPQQTVLKPAGIPSMSLETIVKAASLAIEAIAENPFDLKINGGSIC